MSSDQGPIPVILREQSEPKDLPAGLQLRGQRSFDYAQDGTIKALRMTLLGWGPGFINGCQPPLA